MAKFRFSRLTVRSQLILLAVLLTLPALGIILYSGLEQRAEDYQAAAIESQRLVDDLSARQELLTKDARVLCALLAGLPEVKTRDAEKTRSILGDIHQQNPQYVNILIADATGLVWASAVKSSKADNLADRRYFLNAKRTGNFSSGEFVVSRSTNKPTIHVAYPLLDRGNFNGVIVVGFDLDAMRSILDRARLAHDANYVLADHNGIIINRGKDAPAFIGKPVVPEAWQEMESGPDQNTTEFVRADGDRRINTYRKLWLPGEEQPYMYVRAGISKSEVLARSRLELFTNLSALLLSVLAALLVAFVVGKHAIVDRITILKRASEQLAGGNLNYKVAHQVVGGELGGFARTFDTMASQLKDRETSLLEANRELEAFGYTLSHDLRSHLARISLAQESLQTLEGEHLGKDGAYCLATIGETCQSMDKLIGTMLELAHMSRQELHVEVIDFSALAGNVAAELALANPERNLQFDIMPELQVDGDANLLQVTLENLFGNACKYTSGCTQPRISLRVEQLDGKRVFAVADNGIGFEMREHDLLFRSFQRLSNAHGYPGFGIGLTTVQRIIQRHGGEIWAQAAPGKGATFFFTLPGQFS